MGEEEAVTYRVERSTGGSPKELLYEGDQQHLAASSVPDGYREKVYELRADYQQESNSHSFIAGRTTYYISVEVSPAEAAERDRALRDD